MNNPLDTKKFMLFGGDLYYPLGGLGDYQGSYDTLEEAQIAAEAHFRVEPWSDGWWAWSNIGQLEHGLMYVWNRDQDHWVASETL